MKVSHDARELLVSGPPKLVIRGRLSGTRDEESHDKRTSKNSNVLDATCGSDQLEQSCLNHKHYLEF